MSAYLDESDVGDTDLAAAWMLGTEPTDRALAGWKPGVGVLPSTLRPAADGEP